MAITRAQQFRQMLEDGGMLVKPGIGGKRPGYRGDAAYGERDEDDKVKDTFAAGDGFDRESFQRARDIGEANRALEILKADKEEEKVERFRNRKIDFPGGPGLTPILARIFGKGLQRNAFNLRSNFIRLGNKFAVPDMRRNIITGKMFDANLGKRKSNLIANLLGGKTVGELSLEDQEDIFDQVMDARLSGLTDASGNLAPGVFIGADGQLIDNRDDRGRQQELPIIPKQEEPEKVEEEYVNPLSLLTPRIAGSRYLGSQFAADGGRIGYDDGGMLVSPSKDGKRPGYRRSKYDSTGGGLASSSKASNISPGPGDDDSPQQTTTKPSGGIPAANIFDEAATRAGFKLVDPIQQKRFAQVLKMKKLIEESGLEEPETATDAIGSGATVGPVDLTPEKLKEIRKEADLGSLFGGPSEFAQDKFIERVQDKKYGNPDLDQPGLDAPGILKSIKESDEKAGTDLFKGFDLEDVENVMPLVQADQLPRTLAAEGGIMDLGRQELFLGGIAKGLKKATRGVSRALRKVAKSPIGKAALLGAGLGFAGIGPFKGLAGTKAGIGLKNLFMGKPLGFKTAGDAVARSGGIFDFIKNNPTLAILGSSLFAGAMTPKEEDDNLDLAALYASGQLNPSLGIRGTGSDFEFDFYGARTQPMADGGRIGYQEGSKEPVAKKTMPLLDMDGQEMDLRAEGGFVPIGRMEKADDVPARLSKNEFVFTADAVRNAGDGDVDKGAEVMYNMMKNLERGGNVSDESQGLEGAREMFQTSKRLEEVL